MLTIDGLRVTYGPIVAVDGISLSVKRSKCVALLGTNGAGKSSTLRAISRLTRSEGDIVFDGESIARLPADALARRGLIHVPEGRRVIPTLTVEENIQVGVTARAGRQSTYELSDVYDLFPALVPLRRRRGWALSGGEQQMVAIARALVGSPKLLMLDEPSLGLAPIVVRSVFGALEQIADRTSVVLVEQNTAMALQVADYAYVISQGRMQLEGSASLLSQKRDLLDSLLGISRTDGEDTAPVA